VTQSSIVKAARAEVKFLELRLWQNLSELSQNFITKEIFVANESCDFGLGQNITKSLEALWTDFVQTDVQFSQCHPSLLQGLGDHHDSLITNHVALQVKQLE